MENIIGYTRVSTLKQLNRHSLDFQTDAIKKYCELNKLNLIKIYTDEGVSALKDRPQYNKLIQQVTTDPNINGVVVYDITRFGRSTIELLTNISTIDKLGKKFISIKDNFDISTRTGRLLLGMLALISDFERETTMERMQSGREFAKIKGTKSGKPMHRPRKEIDWEKVKYYRERKLSWNAISKLVYISTPTLIKRAREKGLYV